MSKEQEEQGFRVTDKRGFREGGETRNPEASAEVQNAPDAASPASTEKASSKQESSPTPPIDFSSYVLGYYGQGMISLGAVPSPDTNKTEENLEFARHIIDILTMLEQKTKGNLTKEEQQFMDQVLYELRMRFMAKTNRIKY